MNAREQEARRQLSAYLESKGISFSFEEYPEALRLGAFLIDGHPEGGITVELLEDDE